METLSRHNLKGIIAFMLGYSSNSWGEFAGYLIGFIFVVVPMFFVCDMIIEAVTDHVADIRGHYKRIFDEDTRDKIHNISPAIVFATFMLGTVAYVPALLYVRISKWISTVLT